MDNTHNKQASSISYVSTRINSGIQEKCVKLCVPSLAGGIAFVFYYIHTNLTNPYIINTVDEVNNDYGKLLNCV